jgi:hypothetical protein
MRQADLSLFTPQKKIGDGEREAFALALELKADAVLLDDDGAEVEARWLNLPTILLFVILETAAVRNLLDLTHFLTPPKMPRRSFQKWSQSHQRRRGAFSKLTSWYADGLRLTVSEPCYDLGHEVFDLTGERSNPSFFVVEMVWKMCQPALSIIALMVREGVGSDHYLQSLVQQQVAIRFDDQLALSKVVLFLNLKEAVLLNLSAQR